MEDFKQNSPELDENQVRFDFVKLLEGYGVTPHQMKLILEAEKAEPGFVQGLINRIKSDSGRAPKQGARDIRARRLASAETMRKISPRMVYDATRRLIQEEGNAPIHRILKEFGNPPALEGYLKEGFIRTTPPYPRHLFDPKQPNRRLYALAYHLAREGKDWPEDPKKKPEPPSA